MTSYDKFSRSQDFVQDFINLWIISVAQLPNIIHDQSWLIAWFLCTIACDWQSFTCRKLYMGHNKIQKQKQKTC